MTDETRPATSVLVGAAVAWLLFALLAATLLAVAVKALVLLWTWAL